jgi:sugar lactone lactonase YvrE
MVITALAASATLVAGATAAERAATAGGYKQVGKWGKAGTANGQFNNARGLATNRAGILYVADTDNNRVQIFSANGAFRGKFGSVGSGNGQFQGAHDVVVAPDGTVWVADRGNGRIQRFSASGGFQQAISLGNLQPIGIGVDAEGNLYVVELGGNVTRYEKASDFAAGPSWKGASRAGDLEVSPDGSVYVVDTNALRVLRYTSAGKRLGSFGAGQSSEIGIAVDPDCNVWASVITERRIEKRSPSGKLLATATSPDLIAIDVGTGPKGDVYASHNGDRSIVHFAEDRAKPGTANVPGAIKVSKGVAKIAYTLSGVACPAEVSATATVTGPGISGKAAGLKLKAGAKNTIQMRFSKAGSGKATFKIVLKTNGRPTTETRSVTVTSR